MLGGVFAFRGGGGEGGDCVDVVKGGCDRGAGGGGAGNPCMSSAVDVQTLS